MWLYIWLAVTALSLVIEFITADMVSVWFTGGGIIAMILAACGLGWYVHVPVFIAVSFASMLAFRKLVLKKLGKGEVKTNSESAIGKDFTLLKPISFGNPGEIRINDVVWTAITADENESVPQGAVVTVKALKGNKYIVEVKNA